MKRFLFLWLAVVVLLGSYPGCKRVAPTTEAGPEERGQALTAESFHPVNDPVNEEMQQFRLQTRQAYNQRRFAELEQTAAALRASRETFGNGSWKIVQFHTALECQRSEPESMYLLHDEIHRAWIAACPQPVTAKVAYGNFLTDYAWHARGSGYANTVTADGWKLLTERLAAARTVLTEARALPDYDPYYGLAMLTVALGEGWSATDYEALLKDVTGKEPTFWGYQSARAYSLLPRWYGEPGDWEAYAERCAAAPGGLGVELYARIVMRLSGFYDNVFTETKASWPQTRAGLEVMVKKYPRCSEILNLAAWLATRAQDKAFAKTMLTQMGTSYVASMWHDAGQVAAARAWAETK